MKMFLKKILLFSLLPILALIIWFSYFGMPPPKLSNSITFDGKMLFLKKNFIDTPPSEVLVFGSSISLNNIHSPSILKAFENKWFLNISSWGQNMQENYHLIKIFGKIHKPSSIILASSYMDFNGRVKNIKYNLLGEYVSHAKPTVYFYLKDLDLKHLLTSAMRLYYYRKDTNKYEFLSYDNHGTANLRRKDFIVDSARWDGYVLGNNLISDSSQLFYLDSIAEYCHMNGIKFFYVPSPFRSGYYNKLNKRELALLRQYSDKIKGALHKNKGFYVNTMNKTWPDSLFTDFLHMNEQGAEVFTKYFLQQMKKIQSQENHRD
jgi:hypothetical protein